eukprot:sb/3462313/
MCFLGVTRVRITQSLWSPFFNQKPSLGCKLSSKKFENKNHSSTQFERLSFECNNEKCLSYAVFSQKRLFKNDYKFGKIASTLWDTAYQISDRLVQLGPLAMGLAKCHFWLKTAKTYYCFLARTAEEVVVTYALASAITKLGYGTLDNSDSQDKSQHSQDKSPDSPDKSQDSPDKSPDSPDKSPDKSPDSPEPDKCPDTIASASVDRSSNLIVYGLSESDQQSDSTLIKDLFEHLSEAPVLSEVTRLGRRGGEGVRPVRVVLKNREIARTILAFSRCDFLSLVIESVFISPDRSVEERTERRELVTKLREKRVNEPDKVWRIRRGSIVESISMFINNDHVYGFMPKRENYESMEDEVKGFFEYIVDFLIYQIDKPMPKSKFVTRSPPTKFGFDEIYLINLTRRTERRKRMLMLLELLGIQVKIFDAVDGRQLTQEILDSMEVKQLVGYEDPYHKRALKFGEIGCFLSHFRIWEEMVAKNYQKVLILEDDLRFALNFNSNFEEMLYELEVLNLDWELLYISRKILKHSEQWVRGSSRVNFPQNRKFRVFDPDIPGTPIYRAKSFPPSILVNRGIQEPLKKMIAVDEYLPLMFDSHPNKEWSSQFTPRNLIAYSVNPLLIEPQFYIGQEEAQQTLVFGLAAEISSSLFVILALESAYQVSRSVAFFFNTFIYLSLSLSLSISLSLSLSLSLSSLPLSLSLSLSLLSFCPFLDDQLNWTTTRDTVSCFLKLYTPCDRHRIATSAQYCKSGQAVENRVSQLLMRTFIKELRIS